MTRLTPEPQTPPELALHPRLRAAHEKGWYAADRGWTINACPYRDRACAEAWEAGWRDWHSWLQANRVRACDRRVA